MPYCKQLTFEECKLIVLEIEKIYKQPSEIVKEPFLELVNRLYYSNLYWYRPEQTGDRKPFKRLTYCQLCDITQELNHVRFDTSVNEATLVLKNKGLSRWSLEVRPPKLTQEQLMKKKIQKLEAQAKEMTTHC